LKLPVLSWSKKVPMMLVKGATKDVREACWMMTLPPDVSELAPVNSMVFNCVLPVTVNPPMDVVVANRSDRRAGLFVAMIWPDTEVDCSENAERPVLSWIWTLLTEFRLNVAVRVFPAAPVLPDSKMPLALLVFEVPAAPTLMVNRLVFWMRNPCDDVRAGMLRDGEVTPKTVRGEPRVARLGNVRLTVVPWI